VVYEIKAGRKRLRASAAPNDSAYDKAQPRTPGGSVARYQPLRQPTPAKPLQYGEEDEQASDTSRP